MKKLLFASLFVSSCAPAFTPPAPAPFVPVPVIPVASKGFLTSSGFGFVSGEKQDLEVTVLVFGENLTTSSPFCQEEYTKTRWNCIFPAKPGEEKNFVFAGKIENGYYSFPLPGGEVFETLK